MIKELEVLSFENAEEQYNEIYIKIDCNLGKFEKLFISTGDYLLGILLKGDLKEMNEESELIDIITEAIEEQ